MNVNKCLKLINELNENNIVDVILNYIIYDEINYYDENEIDELYEFMNNNNIKLKENNYEFLYELYLFDYELNNEFIINEFDDLNINYNIIDYNYNNNKNKYDIIVEIFNIDDDEFNEIIKNIRKYNK